MITLSYEQTKAAVVDCIREHLAALVVGPPGCGKTTLVREAADQVGLPLHVLIGSNMDPTDPGGFPYVSNGRFGRAFLPEIQAVINHPGILFLDECWSTPQEVQAALMRIFLERNAGGMAFHPESVVVAAANPPSQCPNGIEPTAAQINRVIQYNLVPDIAELITYFRSLGTAETTLRDEAIDFAATLEVDPSLICLDPPKASVDSVPFASPRAWEAALRLWTLRAATAEDPVARAHLAGAVGEHAALQFISYRRLRRELPHVNEILDTPDKAKVPPPDRRDQAIASFGVLARVAKKDVWAAWTYIKRYDAEMSVAASRILAAEPAKANGSKWQAQGTKAMLDVLGRINKVL